MAWTSPTTRSSSDLITASIWNTDLVDNLIHLHDALPSAGVYHNTTQSLTASTDNVVVFNTERWDTDTLHSTVSNTGRMTIATAGIYLFTFTGEWATAPATCEIEFRLNGTTKIAWAQFSTKRVALTTVYQMAVSDYMEVIINPSGTQTLNSTANYSPEYRAHRIG